MGSLSSANIPVTLSIILNDEHYTNFPSSSSFSNRSTGYFNMAMTDAQREILQKNHTFLLDNISNVVEVCDVLYENGIVSRENSDKINVSRFQSCII